MDRLLSSQEVADRLAIDKRTVARYIRSGKLSGSLIGREYRIQESSVDELLRRTNRVSPAQRSAIVTALANQKGGVGKTTTTLNLAAALHNMGRRVLMVDLDPQAALSASAGVQVAHLEFSIYEALLNDDFDASSILRETNSGVDILPASIDLAAAEIELINMYAREQVLKTILADFLPRYDHILIDCPPSLGLLTVNALVASHRVLIPMQCEYLATRGLALLLRTYERIKSKMNKDLYIAGILPTMFDSRTTHANEVLAELKEMFPGKVYGTPIKVAVRLKESPAAGLTIFDYDPKHDVATAYTRLAEEVDHA